MKAGFETINSTGNTSFLIRKFEQKSVEAPCHFHPEHELNKIGILLNYIANVTAEL